MRGTVHWILSGDDFSGCDTPGSTVDTCFASVHLAFGLISHYFYVDVDSEPEEFFSPFSRRIEKCAQSMPQVMEHACGARTEKSGVSTSLTWMAVGMSTGRGRGQCTGTGPC